MMPPSSTSHSRTCTVGPARKATIDEAWHEAGNEDTISTSLISKIRKDLGLTGKGRVALGLLERMEILSVEILDQRELHHLRLRDLELDARDFRQARLDRPGFERA